MFKRMVPVEENMNFVTRGSCSTYTFSPIEEWMGWDRLLNLFANMCYVHLMNVLEHAIRGIYAQYLTPIMMAIRDDSRDFPSQQL